MSRRRSTRLPGYDYSLPGSYFFTVCTQDRACLFGEVLGGGIDLTDAGYMVAAAWKALPERFRGVDLDAFVVMPNRVHGIITIVGAGLVPARLPAGATTRVALTLGGDEDAVGAGLVPARLPAGAITRVAPALGDLVGTFKSVTTVQYVRGVRTRGWPSIRGRLWQRNYYEHVIRCPKSLACLRQYIFDNPRRWTDDRENPAALHLGLEDSRLW